jgi:hypothetical protein
VPTVDTNPKLSAAARQLLEKQHATDFRILTGAHQYLAFTRPDIGYVVQQVCLLHAPPEPHLAALKHIPRYVRGTLHLGQSSGLF